MKKVRRNRPILLGFAAAIIAAGTYAAYETIPAAHESINALRNNLAENRLFPGAENGKVDPIEAFDNTARNGEIKTIKRLLQEEIKLLDSFARVEDHNTVLAIYPIDVSTSDKPDAKIKYERGYENYTGNDKGLIDRQEEGYFDGFRFKDVPEGSTILAPVDGNLYLYKQRNSQSNHPFSHAIIVFHPSDDETYWMMISGRSTSSSRMLVNDDVFSSLTNAPAYESSPVKSDISPSLTEVAEQAISIKKGQAIMQASDEINIGFNVGDRTESKRTITGTINVNGEEWPVGQNAPAHLELFISDGVIVQPK